ncbi:MAG: hypothetical protein AB7G44_03780 [Bacteroidia bacterium]
MNNTRLIIMLATATLLLSVPFIAMQFSTGVNWSTADFVIMGLLLFATVCLCEFVLRKVKSLKYRLLVCSAILVALIFIWAELAVGLIGSPFAGS